MSNIEELLSMDSSPEPKAEVDLSGASTYSQGQTIQVSIDSERVDALLRDLEHSFISLQTAVEELTAMVAELEKGRTFKTTLGPAELTINDLKIGDVSADFEWKVPLTYYGGYWKKGLIDKHDFLSTFIPANT